MNNATVKALEIAAQITAARLANSNIAVNEAGGTSVARFFEAIYKKAEELIKTSET